MRVTTWRAFSAPRARKRSAKEVDSAESDDAVQPTKKKRNVEVSKNIKLLFRYDIEMVAKYHFTVSIAEMYILKVDPQFLISDLSTCDEHTIDR